MAETISEIQLFGAASVSIGGSNVGHTDEAGVKLALANNIVEALAGKYGQSPVKKWLNGQRAEIEFTLVQTNLADLEKVLPGATRVSGSGKEKLTFGKISGTPLTAVQLIFTSVQAAQTPKYDLTVPSAVPVGDFELTYSGEAHNKWTCKFEVLINEAGGSDGNYMFSFGDASATADTTPPTVSQVVPNDNASGVSVSTDVTWTISEDLDGNTVNNNSVKLIKDPLAGGTDVPGTVTLTNAGASTQIKFDPTSNLDAATQYYAVLLPTIKDKNGNALAFYDSDFQTA